MQISHAASCSTPVSTLNLIDPPNSQSMTIGTAQSTFWDGYSVYMYALGDFDTSINPRCTYVDHSLILDTPFDVYTVRVNTNVNQPMTFIKYLSAGTYDWYGRSSPGGSYLGQPCPYSTCTTSTMRFYVNGAVLPGPPHISTHSPYGTFVAGTTSVSLNCQGECPDPAGCRVYLYDDNDNQLYTKSVSSCTSTNCWSASYTWNGLTAGTYDHRCEVVEKSVSGRYDDDRRTFTINGTTCSSITNNWISPTPVHSSTVNNLTNYFRLVASSSPSSNVDIVYYFCSDTTNTCVPNLIIPYVNIALTSTSQQLSPDVFYDANPGDRYVRWYVTYSFNSPSGCSDVTPRSNNGNRIAWFAINQTTPSLNVTLGSPPNNTQIPISNVPLDFIFTVQATVGTTTDTLYIDGSPVTSGVKPTGLTSFPNVNVGSGIHTWYVTANDGFSTAQSQTWRFTVVQGPSVNLISPVDGYQYANGQTSTSSSPLTWTVSASTSTIDKLIINGITTQTLPATSQFTRTANMAIQGGLVYNWQINSTDTNGLSTLTPSRSFQINCSTIWQKQDISCGMDNRRIIGYVDINNCAFPTIPVPVDNGTYEPCVYCRNEWDCTLYETCQINNTQRCLNVTNIGMIPCANATPSISDIRGKDKTCLFETGVDKIDFSSNELVDVNDPFNRGILPDIYFGIIAWMSTPFLYWLLLIIAALCLFLTAVAVLYWVRNMQ